MRLVEINLISQDVKNKTVTPAISHNTTAVICNYIIHNLHPTISSHNRRPTALLNSTLLHHQAPSISPNTLPTTQPHNTVVHLNILPLHAIHHPLHHRVVQLRRCCINPSPLTRSLRLLTAREQHRLGLGSHHGQRAIHPQLAVIRRISTHRAVRVRQENHLHSRLYCQRHTFLYRHITGDQVRAPRLVPHRIGQNRYPTQDRLRIQRTPAHLLGTTKVSLRIIIEDSQILPGAHLQLAILGASTHRVQRHLRSENACVQSGLHQRNRFAHQCARHRLEGETVQYSKTQGPLRDLKTHLPLVGLKVPLIDLVSTRLFPAHTPHHLELRRGHPQTRHRPRLGLGVVTRLQHGQRSIPLVRSGLDVLGLRPRARVFRSAGHQHRHLIHHRRIQVPVHILQPQIHPLARLVGC